MWTYSNGILIVYFRQEETLSQKRLLVLDWEELTRLFFDGEPRLEQALFNLPLPPQGGSLSGRVRGLRQDLICLDSDPAKHGRLVELLDQAALENRLSVRQAGFLSLSGLADFLQAHGYNLWGASFIRGGLATRQDFLKLVQWTLPEVEVVCVC